MRYEALVDSTKPSFLGPVRARGSPRPSGDDASRPPHRRSLSEGHKPRTASWHSRGTLRHKTSRPEVVLQAHAGGIHEGHECPCLPQPRRHAMSNNLILVIRDSSVYHPGPVRARGSLRPSGNALPFRPHLPMTPSTHHWQFGFLRTEHFCRSRIPLARGQTHQEPLPHLAQPPTQINVGSRSY